MLHNLQSLSFEINLGCSLAGLHKGICPVSDPRRWDKLNTDEPLRDGVIIHACITAYRDLGFRGWLQWHYFNDPVLASDRLKMLIPQIRRLIPQARIGIFTNGEGLGDPSFFELFDRVWLRDYTKRDWSAVLAKYPHVLYDPAPILDARMTTPPSQTPRTRRCRRMWDELCIDYYGNGHICTGDWRGEVNIGNVWNQGIEGVARQFIAVRDQISQEPMSADAPAKCRYCALTMADGDCIIDPQIFAETAIVRGF